MTLPARLRLWPTAEELARMARHPAAYAPTAAEVLTPGPVPKPTVPMGVEERRLMVQWWADYLEANREKHVTPYDYAHRAEANANVVPIKRA